MLICIVCEGCYPYVVGGVSSWIQQLVSAMPQHRFIIYAIGANVGIKGKFKYTLPPNIEAVHEIFLDDIFNEVATMKDIEIKQWEKEELQNLMFGKAEKWGSIFALFAKMNFTVAEFLMTPQFFDVASAVYNAGYEKTLFIEYLWTLRSMYMTLFYVLKQTIPYADLYHSVSTGYSGVVASMGKYFHGKPFILTEHGIYTREREEEIIKADWIQGDYKDLWIKFFYNMSKCAYTFADKVVALFETNSNIQHEMGCDLSKLMVISNGIKTSMFENLPQKEPDDPYINVGAVIRVVAIKDIKTMIYAFDIVKRYVHNAKFFIMGPTDEDEEYYNECVALLTELGTKDVIFTGRINVREYIGKMDVMVITSISEGQPLAVMEGMAAGKAFVTTNVGCCSELLQGRETDLSGECGYTAPVMDFEKIADAIIILCNSPKTRREMGEIAYNRIRKYYTEEKFKTSYVQLYQGFENYMMYGARF